MAEAPSVRCSHQASTCSRRSLLSGLLSAAVLASPHSATAGSPSVRSPTPYDDQHTIQMGVDAEGRIRPCQGGANPNCVSSASRNAMCALFSFPALQTLALMLPCTAVDLAAGRKFCADERAAIIDMQC